MEETLAAAERWLDYLGPSPYLRALAVVVLFLLLAAAAEFVVSAALARLLRRWTGGPGDRIALLARRPVFLTVALGGLAIATLMLGMGERAEGITLGLLQTVVILSWVAFGVRASRAFLAGQSLRDPPPAWARETTGPLLANLLLVVLVLAGAYAVLLAWDVNVTGLVASAGILGLALSFAAQDTLGNLFAGVAILTDQPYRIGDYIVLDSGERGRVVGIGLRSTRLLTRDDEEVSIPNGIMAKAKIVNESGGPHARFRLRVPIGVAYGSDIDHVMRVLLEVAVAHPQVCREPEPRIRLRAFGESSLDFQLLVWIEQPAMRGLALHELNCEIYRAFAREGISIPFPQRDVHIRGWQPPVPGA